MAGNVALPFFGLDPLPWQRPSLATFSTWLNHTNPDDGNTATATDNANGLPLVIQGGMEPENIGNDCLTALLKPIGAPPWTIKVLLAGFTVGASPYALPLVLYDSGNDKAQALAWWPTPTAGAYGKTRIIEYTGTVPGDSSSFVSADGKGFNFPDYRGWFKVDHDGVNITWSISPEGVLFMPIYSAAADAFLGTIDKVGFGYDRVPVSAGTQFDGQEFASILWSWVES
jgi:hypothetical protein